MHLAIDEELENEINSSNCFGNNNKLFLIKKNTIYIYDLNTKLLSEIHIQQIDDITDIIHLYNDDYLIMTTKKYYIYDKKGNFILDFFIEENLEFLMNYKIKIYFYNNISILEYDEYLNKTKHYYHGTLHKTMAINANINDINLYINKYRYIYDGVFQFFNKNYLYIINSDEKVIFVINIHNNNIYGPINLYKYKKLVNINKFFFIDENKFIGYDEIIKKFYIFKIIFDYNEINENERNYLFTIDSLE